MSKATDHLTYCPVTSGLDPAQARRENNSGSNRDSLLSLLAGPTMNSVLVGLLLCAFACDSSNPEPTPMDAGVDVENDSGDAGNDSGDAGNDSGDAGNDTGNSGEVSASCMSDDAVFVGEGGVATIVEALESAPENGVIRVRAGSYPSINIARNHITLCAEEGVTIEPTENYGIRIEGEHVNVEGFDVHSVSREVSGVYHGQTGVVIAGRDVVVRRVSSHENYINGFLVVDGAARVRLEDVRAYNNTVAGIAFGGGEDITISRAVLYNTGVNTDGDGNYQQYGVLTDNVDDTRLVDGEVQDIEGIAYIQNVVIEDSEIRDHLKYGIRVSAGNDELSGVPSGRITTRGFSVRGTLLSRNGVELDDFVGGLYHHGNVLLQHVEGGVFENNRVEAGYTWGVDAYACNNIVYRNNLFVGNNLGLATPNVTIAPAGVEINGGHSNLFENNLVYGNGTGFFSSFIPDSGDAWDRQVDAFDSWTGSYSVEIVSNIITGNTGVVPNPDHPDDREMDETLVDYEQIGPDSFTRVFRNNVLNTVPEWFHNGDPTSLSSDFREQNPHYALRASEIFQDAENGDFRVRSDSPIYEMRVGPASLYE